MSEKLNPSPKVPTGEYPELSPNPNTTDGLIEGAHGIGAPNNPNQEPLTDKPTIINGKLYVNGKLYINGKDASEGVDAAQVEQIIQTKAFAGDVNVSMGEYGGYIKSSDMPTKTGVYRLKESTLIRGILIFTETGGIANIQGMWDNQHFSASAFNYSNDFVFTQHLVKGGTKWYLHTLGLKYTDGETQRNLAFHIACIESEELSVNSIADYANEGFSRQNTNYRVPGIIAKNTLSKIVLNGVTYFLVYNWLQDLTNTFIPYPNYHFKGRIIYLNSADTIDVSTGLVVKGQSLGTLSWTFSGDTVTEL